MTPNRQCQGWSSKLTPEYPQKLELPSGIYRQSSLLANVYQAVTVY